MKKLLQTIAAAANTITTGFSAISALWTFPSIIASAMFIAGASAVAQFLISQGLACAILARRQTLHEFASRPSSPATREKIAKKFISSRQILPDDCGDGNIEDIERNPRAFLALVCRRAGSIFIPQPTRS